MKGKIGAEAILLGGNRVGDYVSKVIWDFKQYVCRHTLNINGNSLTERTNEKKFYVFGIPWLSIILHFNPNL